MVNSLLNTDPEKLSNLLSDPRGSHITDAFMLRFVFFVLLLKRGSSHKTIDFFNFYWIFCWIQSLKNWVIYYQSKRVKIFIYLKVALATKKMYLFIIRDVYEFLCTFHQSNDFCKIYLTCQNIKIVSWISNAVIANGILIFNF